MNTANGGGGQFWFVASGVRLSLLDKPIGKTLFRELHSLILVQQSRLHFDSSF